MDEWLCVASPVLLDIPAACLGLRGTAPALGFPVLTVMDGRHTDTLSIFEFGDPHRHYHPRPQTTEIISNQAKRMGLDY